MFTTGAIAVGAVIGDIAGKAMEPLVEPRQKKTKPMQEEKEQEPIVDVETQLEAVRERLRRLNEELDAPAPTGGT